MFNKESFSKILTSIYKSYNNQREFAEATGVNRAYLSQYINMKIDTPPTPKILTGIANASKGLTTYTELMQICGYLDLTEFYMQPIDRKVDCIPLVYNFDFSRPNIFHEDYIIDYIPFNTSKNIKDYFAYQVSDNSMLPLLDVNDIAIIYKQNNYENGKTYLIIINNSNICIRKILKNKDYIELHAMNPYYPVIKLTDKDFKIIGRVIKAENKSAFK